MTRITAVLGVLIALLLAGVLYELHGLNRRLDATAAATAGFVRQFVATDTRPESPAERDRRLDARARENSEWVAEATEVLKRSLAYDAARRSTRQPTENSVRRPSADTPADR